MRQVAVSVVILGLISGLGYWTNVLLQESAQNLVFHIDMVVVEIKADRWAEAENHIRELEEAWNRHVGWWPIILDHQEIDNIEFSLARCREYVASHDKPLSLGQLSELKMMVEHIPAKEAVTWKNIL
ncbi:MAG: DUF4363 family protein [Syntrophomonadaceae bacterium]|mgnify:CR=1 FL=1|jgi:hypothetical protein|nr:DUF4363 family protein [Syntrophomonadaceae bacterium]